MAGACVAAGWVILVGPAWFGPAAAAPDPPADALPTPAPPTGVLFVNVAREAGLLLKNASGSKDKSTINETVGNGACLHDVDDDGVLDIFLPNGRADPPATRPPAQSGLYRGRGDGTYEEISGRSGVAAPGYWAQGCVFSDYDGDGRVDLFVTGFGRYILYRNLGDRRFQDVTSAAGLSGGRGWSTGAASGDYDGDGRLDLYVSHYVDYDQNSPPLPRPGSGANCMYRGKPVMCGPRGLKPQIGRLFHNEGGRFTDVTVAAGLVTTPEVYGLGAVWTDLDLDGDLDLYVATDSTANYLYRNDGRGRFTEIGTISGTAYSEDGRAQASMGVDSGDYDNDGLFDVVVTNFSNDYSTLYHNEGSLQFQDVSLTSGFGPPTLQTLGWGVVFIDYDNDGLKDIFQANGHVYPGVDAHNLGTTFRQNNQLFRNEGGGRFRESGRSSGPAFEEQRSARGAAAGDLDNDGDVDLVVNNMDETPSLLRNDGGNRNRWIGFRLVGSGLNRFAVGARVTVTSGALRQVGETHAGSSHNSSHDPRLLFGLGRAPGPVQAEVVWPGGRAQSLTDLTVDRYHTIKEPPKTPR